LADEERQPVGEEAGLKMRQGQYDLQSQGEIEVELGDDLVEEADAGEHADFYSFFWAAGAEKSGGFFQDAGIPGNGVQGFAAKGGLFEQGGDHEFVDVSGFGPRRGVEEVETDDVLAKAAEPFIDGVRSHSEEDFVGAKEFCLDFLG
jgi:hypothetical protein